MSKEEEKKSYREKFESFMANRSGKEAGWTSPEDHVVANAATVHRRMEYLKEYVNGKKLDILEIGCSSGFMLFPFMDAGHECAGVEPSSLFSKYAKSKGIPVFSELNDVI